MVHVDYRVNLGYVRLFIIMTEVILFINVTCLSHTPIMSHNTPGNTDLLLSLSLGSTVQSASETDSLIRHRYYTNSDY